MELADLPIWFRGSRDPPFSPKFSIADAWAIPAQHAAACGCTCGLTEEASGLPHPAAEKDVGQQVYEYDVMFLQ